MTGTNQLKIQFVALIERYCALGRLLPVEDDIDFIDDVSAIAEAKLVLREMSQTKSARATRLAVTPLLIARRFRHGDKGRSRL